MRVLVLGGNGQVGQELRKALAAHEVVATTRSGQLPDGTVCEVADFDQPDTLAALVARIAPDAVVNAAAYTAVDKAENEPDAALRANAQAPGVLARACAACGIALVHYSTDYVFDGQGTRPYRPDEATAPLCVYGETKLAGEQAIAQAGGLHLIFRTAWVYGSHGHNFMKTMLRVGADRDELKVVADQVGTPTPARLIAGVTAQVLASPVQRSGTWHLTATGQTSWHGFAEEIFAQAQEKGLVARVPRVQPITTAQYPTPARRPAYSCLDTGTLVRDFGVVLPDWREGVREVLSELAVGQGRCMST